MYSFHKIKEEECEDLFSHPQFRRGDICTLNSIKRKYVQTTDSETPPQKQEDSSREKLKKRIEQLSKRLKALEENDKQYEQIRNKIM